MSELSLIKFYKHPKFFTDNYGENDFRSKYKEIASIKKIPEILELLKTQNKV